MTAHMNPERNVIFKGLVPALLLIFLAVVFSLMGDLARADVPKKGLQNSVDDACRQALNSVLSSCKKKAYEVFWPAIGECENITNPQEREGCKERATEQLKSSLPSCEEDYDALNALCGQLAAGVYDDAVDPRNFVSNVVGNMYYPLPAGTVLTYETDLERTLVHVTDETKQILDVPCRVVLITVTDKQTGKMVEDTIDWYAQDKDGNVWFFGQMAQGFDARGVLVKLEGSWRAGEDGAKPGIFMEANPKEGAVLGRGGLTGKAEAPYRARRLVKGVTVPAGTYDLCLKTEDFSYLEPGVIGEKFYAPGVGLVLTVAEDGTWEELVRIEQK